MMRWQIPLSAFSLLVATNSHALFGVGDIVSDPGSYAYYAEEISQGLEQLKTLRDQYETFKKTQRDMNKLKRTFEHAYEDIRNIPSDYEDIKTIDDAFDFIEDVFEVVEDSGDLIGLSDMYKKIDTRKGTRKQRDYGGIYAGLTEEKEKPEDRYNQRDTGRQLREGLKEKMFVDSSRFLEKLKKTEENLLALAEQIASNKDNAKRAIDINSHILLEIHRTLIELAKIITQKHQLDTIP